MAAPQKVIINGLSPTLAQWNFRTAVTGPDEVSFTAHDCPDISTYSRGDTVPGYGNMRIVDTRIVRVPGTLYDITCNARGLLSGTSRVISRRLTTDAANWDTLAERRMEYSYASVPVFGTPHPNYATMFYMSGGTEESLDLGTGQSEWVQRERTYRGLASPSDKLVSRKISVNENIVSPQDPIVVNLPGGWTSSKKAKVSFPRIVCEDTVLTTTPPPTTSIPGNMTPPNAPQVAVIPISGTLTWNWPHGWKLASLSANELFSGAGVWQQTLNYEFVPEADF